MTRSTARHSHAVQADKSSPPSPSISEDSSDDPSSPAASGVAWYWRLVMFMWIVSFVSLLIYEWLGGAIKSLTSKS